MEEKKILVELTEQEYQQLHTFLQKLPDLNGITELAANRAVIEQQLEQTQTCLQSFQQLLEDNGVIRLRNASHNVADFIALFEAAEGKLTEQYNIMQEQLNAGQKQLNMQMQEIEHLLQTLQDNMTKIGVARWKRAAEDILKMGDEHAHAIKEATLEFLNLTEKSHDRLDRATSYTVKSIAEAINSFRVEDFKQLTDTSCQQVKETTAAAVRRVSNVIAWFHWKNIGMVICLALLITMVFGLYTKDEWPWEMHKEAEQQRNLGMATLKAWSQLSRTDQERILNTQVNTIG